MLDRNKDMFDSRAVVLAIIFHRSTLLSQLRCAPSLFLVNKSHRSQWTLRTNRRQIGSNLHWFRKYSQPSKHRRKHQNRANQINQWSRIQSEDNDRKS